MTALESLIDLIYSSVSTIHLVPSPYPVLDHLPECQTLSGPPRYKPSRDKSSQPRIHTFILLVV